MEVHFSMMGLVYQYIYTIYLKINLIESTNIDQDLIKSIIQNRGGFISELFKLTSNPNQGNIESVLKYEPNIEIGIDSMVNLLNNIIGYKYIILILKA